MCHVGNNRIINALKSMLNDHEYQKSKADGRADMVLVGAVFISQLV